VPERTIVLDISFMPATVDAERAFSLGKEPQMSVQGTYTLEVKTPVGMQQGRLSLVVKGQSLSGVLSSPKGDSEFDGGTVRGGHVEFTAKLRTPMGRMKAHIEGDVVGDRLTATARLPLGTAQIAGVRS
jgi:hypothetical protein